MALRLVLAEFRGDPGAVCPGNVGRENNGEGFLMMSWKNLHGVTLTGEHLERALRYLEAFVGDNPTEEQRRYLDQFRRSRRLEDARKVVR